jgi:hypothetical protein
MPLAAGWLWPLLVLGAGQLVVAAEAERLRLYSPENQVQLPSHQTPSDGAQASDSTGPTAEVPQPFLDDPFAAETGGDDPIAAELNFNRNIAYQRAVSEEEQNLFQDPNCCPQAGAAPVPRPWNLTILTAYEYDSNLRSYPRFEGLGSNIDYDDSRAVLAAFGEYRLVQREGWNLGVIGSAFDSFHFDQDRFNLQDYMGGAYTNVALGEFIAGLRYEFHETRLGGNHLASDNRLVPNLTYMGYDWGHTTVYYEHDTAASNAPFLIPAQIQSGSVNAVGLTQAIYTSGGQGRVYFGYRYQDVEAVGDDFDRVTSMVTGRIEQPLGYGVIYDIEARFFWDDYQNPNSLDFFGRPRADERLELRSGLQRNFTPYITGRLDYTYINSRSNVENLFGVHFFQYDRHVVSTQLIYDF